MTSQIKPQELLKLAIGFESGSAVTIADVTNAYPGAGAIVESVSDITFANGGKGHSNAETAAEMLLESLDKAGYEIVQKRVPIYAPAIRQMDDRKETKLMGDLEGVLPLEGKMIAEVTKSILISEGFVSMSLIFTDGTSLNFKTAAKKHTDKGQLDVTFIEPA